MNTRSFNDFTGLLADAQAEAMDGCAPSVGDKHRLFSALSYQQPSDIPGGLAALTELFNTDPDDLQRQYDAHLAETAAMRDKPRPASVALKPRSGYLENRSDSGNASRLVTKFYHCLRFCHDINRWLIWDGTCWAVDDVGAIMQYARATVQDIYREAGTLGDAGERKAHTAHALRSESESRLKAMVSLARSEAGIPVRRAQLDAHPLLLNVVNGVINLDTGDLLDHSPDLFFTKILPWTVDPDMPTPTWDRFLSEITGGDAPTMAFLQYTAGYCLTASTREQCFFIFWGDGRNGKSTFIRVLLEMLGPWAAQTPAQTLMAKKNSSESYDLARLWDKRLVCAIETEEGGRLAEGLIKSLAGSDRVAARAPYEQYFEYDPTFKVILTTNHKPRIRGTDFAIWRRIRLVPFTWKIPDDRVDPDIFNKLKAEMPGILAWAVKGCLEWKRIGKLESPDKVKSAVEEYQKDQDVMRKFTDDVCEIKKSHWINLKELYELYEKWCKDNGEYFLSKNMFSRKLVEMGIKREHTESGARMVGIGQKGNDLF